MNLIAILAALGLEQWRAFWWRASVERAFVQYVRAVERRLNGGTAQQGMIATVIALAPPVLLAVAVFFALTALHPLLGLAWPTREFRCPCRDGRMPRRGSMRGTRSMGEGG